MTETSDEEDAWMDKYLQSIPSLHETECSVCHASTLYNAWCQQHGMKECQRYKTQKAPKTCGMLACGQEVGESWAK